MHIIFFFKKKSILSPLTSLPLLLQTTRSPPFSFPYPLPPFLLLLLLLCSSNSPFPFGSGRERSRRRRWGGRRRAHWRSRQQRSKKPQNISSGPACSLEIEETPKLITVKTMEVYRSPSWSWTEDPLHSSSFDGSCVQVLDEEEAVKKEWNKTK